MSSIDPINPPQNYPNNPPPRPSGPSNHLVLSILSTLCCCVPTGIAAIVYAAQVDGKTASGDYAGAQAASDNAKMWSYISIGLGLATVAIYGVLMCLGLVSDPPNNYIAT